MSLSKYFESDPAVVNEDTFQLDDDMTEPPVLEPMQLGSYSPPRTDNTLMDLDATQDNTATETAPAPRLLAPVTSGPSATVTEIDSSASVRKSPSPTPGGSCRAPHAGQFDRAGLTAQELNRILQGEEEERQKAEEQRQKLEKEQAERAHKHRIAYSCTISPGFWRLTYAQQLNINQYLQYPDKHELSAALLEQCRKKLQRAAPTQECTNSYGLHNADYEIFNGTPLARRSATQEEPVPCPASPTSQLETACKQLPGNRFIFDGTPLTVFLSPTKEPQSAHPPPNSPTSLLTSMCEQLPGNRICPSPVSPGRAQRTVELVDLLRSATPEPRIPSPLPKGDLPPAGPSCTKVVHEPQAKCWFCGKMFPGKSINTHAKKHLLDLIKLLYGAKNAERKLETLLRAMGLNNMMKMFTSTGILTHQNYPQLLQAFTENVGKWRNGKIDNDFVPFQELLQASGQLQDLMGALEDDTIEDFELPTADEPEVVVPQPPVEEEAPRAQVSEENVALDDIAALIHREAQPTSTDAEIFRAEVLMSPSVFKQIAELELQQEQIIDVPPARTPSPPPQIIEEVGTTVTVVGIGATETDVDTAAEQWAADLDSDDDVMEVDVDPTVQMGTAEAETAVALLRSSAEIVAFVRATHRSLKRWHSELDDEDLEMEEDELLEFELGDLSCWEENIETTPDDQPTVQPETANKSKKKQKSKHQ